MVVEASTNEGEERMDVNIPSPKEGDDSNHETLEIQDDCLSLPNIDMIEAQVEELKHQ